MEAQLEAQSHAPEQRGFWQQAKDCLGAAVRWVGSRFMALVLFLNQHLVMGLVGIAVVFLIFAYLGYLQSYAVASLAAGATLLTALPRIVASATPVSVLAALTACALAGFSGWYTTTEFEAQKTKLEQQAAAKSVLLEVTNRFVENLNVSERDAIAIRLALVMRNAMKEKTFDLIFEVSSWLRSLDPENGHGIYFLGEYWRIRNDRQQMNGLFLNYLSLAANRVESREGNAETCYQRAKGYCGERTAWIRHILANDYYKMSQATRDDAARSDALQRALNQAEESLKDFNAGFAATKSFVATKALRQAIVRELDELKKREVGKAAR